MLLNPIVVKNDNFSKPLFETSDFFLQLFSSQKAQETIEKINQRTQSQVVRSLSENEFSFQAIIPNESIEVKEWALSVFQSVQDSNNPEIPQEERQELTPYPTNKEGVNGSYFIRQKVGDTSKIVAIFKPSDESVGAVNGKKSEDIIASKYGIIPGHETTREVIASMLFGKLFGIPDTIMITLRSPAFHRNSENSSLTKSGSLQRFVPDARNFHEIPEEEQASIKARMPQKETHKIAIIDLMSDNTDRNKGNLLLSIDRTNNYTLHPIDHGCIISRKFQDSAAPIWLDFHGAETSFTEEEKQFIFQVDMDSKVKEIKKLFKEFSQEDEFTLRISHMVLKEGAKQNLSPLEISLMYQKFHEYLPSINQKIYQTAEKTKSKEQFLRIAQESIQKNLHLISDFFQGSEDKFVRAKEFRSEFLALKIQMNIEDKKQLNPLVDDYVRNN